MKHIILTCALFIIMYYAAAQDSGYKIKSPVLFQSLIQAGFLAGKKESSFEVQSINGLRLKTFYSGIGIGIDDYTFRSIPLFFDLRKDILKTGNSPFIFADAGWQLTWLEDKQKAPTYLNPEYNGKAYFNAGAGYKINLLKKNAIVFSAAFSLKKINETENYYCDFVACPVTPLIINKYIFRRFSLKAGWMIW